ncbi:hypothetical protein SERLADRAFT_443217 [Serpula lacrymans var. lacrymans S7.9]|uniref:Uncharacterized protein n=1 Tax=Serpula lacrymans var. lacrymans (strain S7.9) TaxID=578457 RepID=F8PBW9_SERL9|nr:uncharacterized protein SERLADRAFT_443217 [Serpula lacrymans var. lacrymans S7.9]EGO19172.1 hypothetical protein SERLADRAFT_443217 [Serpula lacrymans var. lacrymans S7.9]
MAPSVKELQKTTDYLKAKIQDAHQSTAVAENLISIWAGRLSLGFLSHFSQPISMAS